ATGTQWGPRETLETIPASAYPIENAITVNVPGRSVQFIMVEAGTNLLYPTSAASELKNEFEVTNYPNPFTSITTIQFRTPSNAPVSLDVFDQSGKMVATLVNSVLPSGTHHVEFDGSFLPGGMYFYQLKVGKSSTTRKMIIVK